jgi:hypothetical protein
MAFDRTLTHAAPGPPDRTPRDAARYLATVRSCPEEARQWRALFGEDPPRTAAEPIDVCWTREKSPPAARRTPATLMDVPATSLKRGPKPHRSRRCPKCRKRPTVKDGYCRECLRSYMRRYMAGRRAKRAA